MPTQYCKRQNHKCSDCDVEICFVTAMLIYCIVGCLKLFHVRTTTFEKKNTMGCSSSRKRINFKIAKTKMNSNEHDFCAVF